MSALMGRDQAGLFIAAGLGYGGWAAGTNWVPNNYADLDPVLLHALCQASPHGARCITHWALKPYQATSAWARGAWAWAIARKH